MYCWRITAPSSPVWLVVVCLQYLTDGKAVSDRDHAQQEQDVLVAWSRRWEQPRLAAGWRNSQKAGLTGEAILGRGVRLEALVSSLGGATPSD